MDDKAWLLPLILAVIILVPLSVILVYLVRDRLKAQNNLAYKSLAEHEFLNNSGNREAWMTGVIPREGDEQVDRFSSRIAPLAQLAMLFALVVVILVWNESLVAQNAKQDERLGQIELQLHALTFATPVASSGPRESEPLVPGMAQPAPINPMQQACANLIGRVADAYEKGENSKIAAALEQMVTKLGCKNSPVP